MSRFGFAGSILLFLAAFMALVYSTALFVPAFVHHLAAFDARVLARDWLSSMQVQFDLPGTPPPFELSFTDKLAGSLLRQDLPDGEEIDVFRPIDFQSLTHFGQIEGYTVFTRFGELFIAGGRPRLRSFENRQFIENAQKAMRSQKTIVFSNPIRTEGRQPSFVVIVPLAKSGAPRGIVSIEVKRHHIEGVMERGVQLSSFVTACILALLATIVIITLLYWGRKIRRTEREAALLAFFDPLTGLPNRRKFSLELQQKIETAQKNNTQFGLLSVDVDKFKQVNDLYGHGAGDAVLIEIGKRLQKHIGPKDQTFRLSGDEFVIIADLYGDTSAQLRHLCAALVKSMSAPIKLENSKVETSLSLGAAAFPTHCRNGKNLLRMSDAALYDAKQHGHGEYSVYSSCLDHEMRHRSRLERDLRHDLAAGKLQLAYQPQVDSINQELVGFEALARWTHDELGPISPEIFISIAEQSGLIHALGTWALNQACREATKWDKNLTLAVNLSPLQLRDIQIVNQVWEALGDSGLEPHRLELEITEGVFVYDTAQVRQTLNELRDLGVGVAMDDFGTGYSSLSYLTRIPLTKLKIDRSFTSNFQQGEADDAVVHCVISMSKSLQLSVVAEGVETEHQAHFLKEIGCDILQGYYFGKPTITPRKWMAENPTYHVRAAS